MVTYYHEMMESAGEGTERGNRAIEILHAAILNEHDEPSSEFRTGDSLKIRVAYMANEPVEDLVFGLSIEDYRGFTAYGTNTSLKGMELGTIAGEGFVTFNLKSLPMLEGRYLVSLAIHSRDEQTTYHWMDRHEMFDMHSDFNDAGLIYIPSEVEISRPGEVTHEPG